MKKKLFNPFPGLRSFEEEEEYLFFGREKQIDELVSKLGKTRFLAVVGASGSGKSSLVKSGLLPAIHSGYLLGSGANSGWRICTIRPGSDPIGNLASGLASPEILGDETNEFTSATLIESILRRSVRGIGEVIKQLSQDQKQNILIVVDQFEELFRFSRYEKNKFKDTRDSVTFINLLLDASASLGVPIYVVLTMRSDFLGDCTEFRGLPEAINASQYLIPRMTREERKAAINGPISVGGAEISHSLLTRLLNDVGDNPDQLPILQHALMRTWDYWQTNSSPDKPIDLLHYESIGTMVNALSTHAEEAYADIKDEKGKEICKKIFCALTEKLDGGSGTRRPSQVKELCELAEANLSEIATIVDVFRKVGRSFLMPPFGVELNDETIIDISHESLMRVWQRLILWVREEGESAEIYTRLAKSALLFEEGKAGLWRDPELLMTSNWQIKNNPNAIWAKRYDPSYDRAILFLKKSQAEKDFELLMSEKKRRAALFRLRLFISTITVAFCFAVYFGYQANESKKMAVEATKNAFKQKRISDSLKLIAEADRTLASKAKDKAVDSEKKAEAEKLIAIVERGKAIISFEQSLKSLSIAKKATQTAEIATLNAERQKIKADLNAEKAKVAEKIALNSKIEVDHLRMLAEAKNIALKSSHLINDVSADTLSLHLAFLSYALNLELNGPLQNRVIYDALKNQLTKYYIKNIRSRLDLKSEASAYDLRSLVFLSDKEFLTVGDEGVIKKFLISNNPIEIKSISQSKKFSESFTNICLTSDRQLIVLGTTSGKLVTFDPNNMSSFFKIIYQCNSKIKFIYNISSTENSYTLLSVSEKEIAFLKFDKNTGQLILKTNQLSLPDDLITASTAYSEPDKTIIIFSQGKSVYTTSVSSNGEFSTIKKCIDADFKDVVSCLSSSKNGKCLAIGGYFGNLNVYKNSSSGYFIFKQPRSHMSLITAISFASDDSILISSSLDHSIYICQLLKNKEEDFALKEKELWIRNFACTPNEKFVVSVGKSGLVQVWPINSKIIMEELIGINYFKPYFKARVSENLLKKELGDELFQSLWTQNLSNKNFTEYWKFLNSKYIDK